MQSDRVFPLSSLNLGSFELIDYQSIKCKTRVHNAKTPILADDRRTKRTTEN
jgi:hypothetical protein